MPPLDFASKSRAGQSLELGLAAPATVASPAASRGGSGIGAAGLSFGGAQPQQQPAPPAQGGLAKLGAGLQGGGVPQFKDNPIAAIGFVLQEVARGLKGQGSSVGRLRANALRQQQFLAKRISFGSKAALSAIDLASTKPKAEREAFVTNFLAASGAEKLAPGTTESALQLLKDAPTLKALRSVLPNFSEIATIAGGSLDGAKALLSNAQFMKTFKEGVDARNTPEILLKGKEYLAGLKQRGLPTGPFTLEQLKLANAQALKSGGTAIFSASEFLTISRNDDLKRALNIVPGADQDAQRKAGLEIGTARAKSRITQEEKIRTGALSADITLPDGSKIQQGTPFTGRVRGDKISGTVQTADGKSRKVTIPLGNFIQGAGGGIPQGSQIASASQRGLQETKLAGLKDGVTLAQTMIELIRTNRTKTGAAKSVVQAFQGTLDAFRGLVGTLPGAESMIKFIEDAKKQQSIGGANTKKDRLFNPNLAMIDLFQEALAIKLASGSFLSLQRVPVETIRNFRDKVNLSGLLGPGPKTAIAKLNAAILILNQNITSGEKLLQRQTGSVIKTKQKRRVLDLKTGKFK